MKKESLNIFDLGDFEEKALAVFRYQIANNAIYQNYCNLLGVKKEKVQSIKDIPFLPISFFKSQEIKSFKGDYEQLFLSSGTTQMERSKHYVRDLSFYHQVCRKNFEHFYGALEDYQILCYLPSYHANPNSSLLSMCNYFFEIARPGSGFYYQRPDELMEKLRASDTKTILFGVSYALLDLIELYPELPSFKGIIMETGGMKGRRKEMIRSQLHQLISEAFKVPVIHSEYGMSELMSQAYSLGSEVFNTPPWMRFFLRDPYDALSLTDKKRGALNIIDLANIDSCAFIATEDLAEKQDSGYKILGRMDYADIRGCNLLIS